MSTPTFKTFVMRCALAVVLCGLSGALSAAATLTGLSVPATAVAGQDITVSFNTGSGCTYVGIALSPFSSFVCPSTNGYPYPWVLHDTVHYAGGFDAAPDYRGLFGGGLNTGCAPQSLSYVIRIPPDAPATVYVHVFASSTSMVIWGNNPCSYDVGLTSAAVSVSGGDSTLRVDLLSQRTTGGEAANVYQLAPVVQNWGLWPVDVRRFCLRMWVHEPASPAIVALSGSHFNIALNSGANWGPAMATPFTLSVARLASTSVCSASRQSDWQLSTCYTGVAGYIPGNGGYFKPGNDGDNAGTWWAGGGAFTKTDDYSQAASLGMGFAGRTEDFHYALYDGGSLVCERISWSANDPATGQEPCGISACVTPTYTPTPSATYTPSETPTPTYTPTITPSPTVTPRMALTKTVNVSQATIGDTITYCLNWENDSSASQPMVIWDTLDPVLSYVGGSPAPTVSGQYLHWDLGSVGSGTTGQICFWVRITGYP